MKKKAAMIVVVAALMIPVMSRPALCAPFELNRFVDKLESEYGAMKDLSARFAQETSLRSVRQVERAAGEVYFKKGGKMLWNYSTPEVQKFILDGTNLWVYQPAENQVMKNTFSALPQHIVLDLFSGKVDIQKRFKVALAPQSTPEPAAEVVLELVPLEYDPTVTKLMLWIDPVKYYITKSVLDNEVGNSTVIMFSDIKVNKGIDDALFTFVPPAGVEIFEPPQK
jgi:outer membrane lipoprotein carrier protein